MSRGLSFCRHLRSLSTSLIPAPSVEQPTYSLTKSSLQKKKRQ
jgi:hypothetical protein